MICTNCSAEVPPGNAFCHLCGTPLTAPRGSAQPRVNPPTAAAVYGAQSTAATSQMERKARAQYSGATLVSWFLLVLGWLLAGVTVIGAFAIIDDADLKNELSGGQRFGVLILVLAVGWVYASIPLWMSYSLRLFGDIERNTKDQPI